MHPVLFISVLFTGVVVKVVSTSQWASRIPCESEQDQELTLLQVHINTSQKVARFSRQHVIAKTSAKRNSSREVPQDPVEDMADDVSNLVGGASKVVGIAHGLTDVAKSITEVVQTLSSE